MIAIGFFAVGGTLGPAHGELGNAEGGNVGKIVDSVVQQGDATAKNAAKNLSDNQAERGDHGPAENRGR